MSTASYPVNRVPDILKRMDLNSSQAEAMKTCFGILAIMSRDESNKLLIAKDGIEIILNAMSIHVDRTDVQESGCDLLWSLAFNNSAVKEIIAKHGGATVLVRALKRHNKSSDFLKSACGALSNMCQSKLNQEGVSSQGGLQPLVGSIHIHQTNAKLLPFIFDAIASIVVNNEENARSVSSLGIIPIIVASLSRHKQSTDIVKSGCHTLAILSDVKGQASKIAFAGGVPIILSLLDLHPLYSDLHRVAAVVLLRMLQESSHVGREIAGHEGVRILLHSLDRGGAQQDTVAAVTHILYTVTNPLTASAAVEAQLWIVKSDQEGEELPTANNNNNNKTSTKNNNKTLTLPPAICPSSSRPTTTTTTSTSALGGLSSVLSQHCGRRDVVRAACRLINNLCVFPSVVSSLDQLCLLDKMLECVALHHRDTKDVLDSTASLLKTIHKKGVTPTVHASSSSSMSGLLLLFRSKSQTPTPDEDVCVACVDVFLRLREGMELLSLERRKELEELRSSEGRRWEVHVLSVATGLLDGLLLLLESSSSSSEMDFVTSLTTNSSSSSLLRPLHRQSWSKSTVRLVGSLLLLLESFCVDQKLVGGGGGGDLLGRDFVSLLQQLGRSTPAKQADLGRRAERLVLLLLEQRRIDNNNNNNKVVVNNNNNSVRKSTKTSSVVSVVDKEGKDKVESSPNMSHRKTIEGVVGGLCQTETTTTTTTDRHNNNNNNNSEGSSSSGYATPKSWVQQQQQEDSSSTSVVVVDKSITTKKTNSSSSNNNNNNNKVCVEVGEGSTRRLLPLHPSKAKGGGCRLLECWPVHLERLAVGTGMGMSSYNNNNNTDSRMSIVYESGSAAGKGLLSKCPTPVPYVVPSSSDNNNNSSSLPFEHSLSFDADFESGNLLRAVQRGDAEYDLFLRSDLHTAGHTQWFYFAVSNTHPTDLIRLWEQGVQVPPVRARFNIVNLTKPDSLFNLGMRPVAYSCLDALSKGIGWVRGGVDISYYSNNFNRNNSAGEGFANYYTLSFTMEFQHPKDTVLVAYSYPYTMEDYRLHLNQILSRNGSSDVIRQTKLCKTLGGEDCDLLVITNFKDKDKVIGPITMTTTFESRDEGGNLNNNKQSNRKESKANFKMMKPALFLSGRVHPGETPASWMMKGILDYLTSDCSQAKLLRNVFVIFVVPVLNPDGVVYGNNRCSLAGVDLNRQWKIPSKTLHPTVYSLKSFMMAQRKIREIGMYIDLHGHSRKYNVFMYGCDDKKKPKPQVRAFPKFFSMHTIGRKYVCYSDCSFHVKKGRESTARVVVAKEINIPCSFTLEATFCGSNYGPLKHCHMNIGHLQEVGSALCDAILNFSISEGQVKDTGMVPGNLKAVMQVEKALAEDDNDNDNDNVEEDEEEVSHRVSLSLSLLDGQVGGVTLVDSSLDREGEGDNKDKEDLGSDDSDNGGGGGGGGVDSDTESVVVGVVRGQSLSVDGDNRRVGVVSSNKELHNLKSVTISTDELFRYNNNNNNNNNPTSAVLSISNLNLTDSSKRLDPKKMKVSTLNNNNNNYKLSSTVRLSSQDLLFVNGTTNYLSSEQQQQQQQQLSESPRNTSFSKRMTGSTIVKSDYSDQQSIGGVDSLGLSHAVSIVKSQAPATVYSLPKMNISKS